MEKYFLGLLGIVLSLSLIGCANQTDKKPVEHFVGKMQEQQLLSQYDTFSKSYDAFTVEEADIAEIKSWPSDLKINVYFGTWCPDSQREVPRLLKILHHNEQIKVSLLALDFTKSDPEGLAKAAGVTHTATFIVSLEGKEIGRIVERPEQSLVADITAMLAP